MNKSPLEIILDLAPPLVEEATPFIDKENGLKNVTAGSVLGSKVVIDTLNYFSKDARPLSVKVLVFNSPASLRFHKGEIKKLPTAQTLQQWWEEDGSWFLGRASNLEAVFSNQWTGHSVAITSQVIDDTNEPKRLLVDLSLPMIKDTEHNIEGLVSVVGVVNDDFLNGKMPVAFQTSTCLVVYAADNKDKEFKQVSWWKQSSPVTGKVIRKVREVLGGD
jgi:hypothetical protein